MIGLLKSQLKPPLCTATGQSALESCGAQPDIYRDMQLHPTDLY